MIDNSNINALQIKSFDRNGLDHYSSYQNVTERDEWYFEDCMRDKPCRIYAEKITVLSPDFEDTETSIENTSELISLFFNEGSNKDE